MAEEEARLAGRRLFPTPSVNRELEARGTSPIKIPSPFLSLVKRPQLDLPTLYRLAGEEPPVPPAVVDSWKSSTNMTATSSARKRPPGNSPRGRAKASRRTLTMTGCRGSPGKSGRNCSRCGHGPWDRGGPHLRATPAALAVLMVYLKRGGSRQGRKS